MVFAPNLGWRNVDFKQYLERTTGLPVEVDNAANSCALYELWFGRHSEGLHDLVAVTVSEIGTGIIANDQLIIGPGGMAGDSEMFRSTKTGRCAVVATAAVGRFMLKCGHGQLLLKSCAQI